MLQIMIKVPRQSLKMPFCKGILYQYKYIKYFTHCKLYASITTADFGGIAQW